MPADRPGDPGSDTPKVAAGSRGPSRPPSSASGAGPKRTPRPGPGARRGPAKAAGAKGVAAKGNGAKGNGAKPVGNRSGGDGNGSAARAAARPKASTARVLLPTAPSPDRPIGDDATAVTAFPVGPPVAPAPAVAAPFEPTPVPVEPPVEDGTRRRRGRRGRRVRRVVRRIELWSVLKLSLVLYTCLYLAVLGALIVIWGLAYSSGQIGNLQDFLADVGLENYRFYGNQMFRACAAIGAVGVLAGTIVTVFTAALVNLISEITGGIRLIVIEEEPPARR